MRLTPKQRDVLVILQMGGKLRAPLCDDGPEWWLTSDDYFSDFWSAFIQERTVRAMAAKGLVEMGTWEAKITDKGREALADAIAA